MPTPLRRIAAAWIDWLFIVLYGSVLFGIVMLVSRGQLNISKNYDPVARQVIGFTSLTLPVLLYFVVSEYRFAGTLGKRIMGMRLSASGNRPLLLGQVIKRNLFKFLPWELAHFCVHQFVAASLQGREPSPMVSVALAVVYIMAGFYLVTLFRDKQRQTFYDRISGIKVLSEPERK